MLKAGTIIRHRLDTPSGVRLVYAEHQPEHQTGPDIVLVHGLASSGLQFEREAAHFAAKGHRVIVPDLRGHGGSGVPEGLTDTAHFSIPTLAGDLLTILAHADAEQVHWVGNSLGGILALWLLGTPHQKRLSSLALFGTCFSLNLPPQVSQVLRMSFLPGRAVTAWWMAQTTTRSPHGRTAIAAAIRQLNIEAGAAIAANVRRYDFLENARSFNRPLLVLRGGKDHAVNLGLGRNLRQLADCPHIRPIELPHGGHCANFDMPEQFREGLAMHWATTHQP